ncbi:hypothetical protein EC973_004057 [Apophysomyces ossiformis]|uniref:PA domain-containing protein n=1 Tax=Apophysomyces ossiformis TaxID=679940 RepID=A0A8H7BIS1_9FUNG|nr:hypothetical protein EC973_004057 [Apophysomyces ossiformis]
MPLFLLLLEKLENNATYNPSLNIWGRYYTSHVVVAGSDYITERNAMIERVIVPIDVSSDEKLTEHEEWQIDKNVFTTEETPMAPQEGLRGILYDRGLSCESMPTQTTVTIPSNMTKIALIGRGDCPFTHKLLLAEMDGASAVIVYNNITFDSDQYASYGMAIKPRTIHIPAYYVDLPVGLKLREALLNASASSIAGSQTSFVRVTLFPPKPSMMEPWKLALGVTGLILTACFVIAGKQHNVVTGGKTSASSMTHINPYQATGSVGAVNNNISEICSEGGRMKRWETKYSRTATGGTL